MITANLNKLNNFIFILICLIPALLVSGPLLSDFCVVIISVIFLIFYRKEINFKNTYILIFFLFFVILLLSTFFSDNFIFSLKKTLSYLRFLFFSLAIFYIVREKKIFLNYFSKIFITTFSVVLLDGYFQAYFGHNFFGFVTPIQNRLSGFFGDEMILGSFLSRFLPLLLFSLFYLNKSKKVIIFFLFSSTLLIFLTGERTAFLYAIIVNIYLICQIKFLRIYGILSLFLIIVSSFILYSISPKVKSRIDQTFVEIGFSKKFKPGYSIGDTPINNAKDKKIFQKFNFFSPMHENYLYTSLKMFQDKPIFGHGPNSYRLKCSSIKYKIDHLSCSTHPHNTYLQILAELGIVGFFFISSIFLYFCFISLRHFIYSLLYSHNNKFFLTNLELSLVVYFLINLWPLAPSGNFFNNWLSIIYFFPVGFYLGLKHIKHIDNAK